MPSTSRAQLCEHDLLSPNSSLPLAKTPKETEDYRTCPLLVHEKHPEHFREQVSQMLRQPEHASPELVVRHVWTKVDVSASNLAREGAACRSNEEVESPYRAVLPMARHAT